MPSTRWTLLNLVSYRKTTTKLLTLDDDDVMSSDFREFFAVERRRHYHLLPSQQFSAVILFFSKLLFSVLLSVVSDRTRTHAYRSRRYVTQICISSQKHLLQSSTSRWLMSKFS